MALKRAVLSSKSPIGDLLAAGVLGDSLGSFADSVLGELSRQKQTYSGLNLSACDCRPLIVVGESGSFSGNPLKDVVDKAVHDRHGLARDTSVGVHLLQHFVNVDAVGFLPPPPALLVPSSLGLGLAGSLLGALLSDNSLGWHDYT